VFFGAKKDRAKNGVSKRGGGRGEGRKLQAPPLSFFGYCAIIHVAKTENPIPWSFFAL